MMAEDDPASRLASIIAALADINSPVPDERMALLAAGPLEDLLVAHGPAVVDEVDRLARQDPRFRLLLNGVWDGDIDASVLARLEKYRTARW